MEEVKEFSHRSTSVTPFGCPITQLNSDIIYVEIASDPTGRGSVPLDYPCFRHQSQVQIVACIYDGLPVKWGSHDSLLGFYHLLNGSQSSGKILRTLIFGLA